jgi:hypothetical protein
MTRRTLLGAAVAALLALGAAACGDDETADPAGTTREAGATTTTEAVPADALPPPGALELESIYGASLAEIGLQLTDRGGLIDRSGGGYEPAATGRHLALYVEPIGERSTEEYIDGILGVATVFSDVFDRWPGLESYDVCQEPVEDGDEEPGTEPLPVTQIELTRAEAAAIDWDTVTVVDLVRSSRADPPGLALRVSTELINDPAFEVIVEEAS